MNIVSQKHSRLGWGLVMNAESDVLLLQGGFQVQDYPFLVVSGMVLKKVDCATGKIDSQPVKW